MINRLSLDFCIVEKVEASACHGSQIPINLINQIFIHAFQTISF